jgi:organic radical activating enzyme
MNKFKMAPNWTDYPDSSKMAISIFFNGCDFNCKSCHNEEMQDHTFHDDSYGSYENVQDLADQIISFGKRNRTDNFAIMGGDPLHPKNRKTVTELTHILEESGNVIVFTGYDMGTVKESNIKFTYLKRGLYRENLAQESKLTDNEFHLGSTNQKLYNSDFKLLSKAGIYKYN